MAEVYSSVLPIPLHIRYQVEGLPTRSKACNVQVFMGIAWLKSTKHQKRVTKNAISNLADHLKEMFSLVKKEFTPGKLKRSIAVDRMGSFCFLLIYITKPMSAKAVPLPKLENTKHENHLLYFLEALEL